MNTESTTFLQPTFIHLIRFLNCFRPSILWIYHPVVVFCLSQIHNQHWKK